MAIKVNKDTLTDESPYSQETLFIEEGTHPAVLVSYVELGKHYKLFNNAKVVYGKDSKKAGEVCPPALLISLCFEFPNAKYTGDFPLCIATSVPKKAGGTLNTLAVSDALASGNLSRSFAMKTNFMKYLMAMQDATGKNYNSIDQFVGHGFLIKVTNKIGKPDQNGNTRTYANMKPDGISSLSFKHPVTGVVEEVPCPDVIGNYCPVFDWDNPDIEAYKLLPSYMQAFIQKAENFPGSEIEALIKGRPTEEGTEDYSVPKDNDTPAEPINEDDIPF